MVRWMPTIIPLSLSVLPCFSPQTYPVYSSRPGLYSTSQPPLSVSVCAPISCFGPGMRMARLPDSQAMIPGPRTFGNPSTRPRASSTPLSTKGRGAQGRTGEKGSWSGRAQCRRPTADRPVCGGPVPRVRTSRKLATSASRPTIMVRVVGLCHLIDD